MPNQEISLFKYTLDCILLSNIEQKIALTRQCKLLWDDNKLLIQADSCINRIITPGRPDKPELVWPRDLPKRKLNSLAGRAALLHAIAHIEFNAINLALDAVYRFQDMPKEYYTDWLQIAVEEAKHFELLYNYLKELGYNYGDFPAHNGLWELAIDTDYDVLARMALVPRIMEARGLDVTPGIINKFITINDYKAVEILNIILEEEKGHVYVGNKWFNYICEKRNLESIIVFKDLIKKHIKGQIKPPFSREHRLEAGFTEQELDILEKY